MSGSQRWLGPLLLVVLVLFAGWRTYEASRLVLAQPGAPAPTAEHAAWQSEDAKVRRQMATAEASASILASMQQEKLAQDPFRPRPVAENVVVVKPPPKPPEIQVPTVVLAAVDAARPEVVLRVGDQVSGLLARGNVWNGWTVVSIAESGIVIEGFGRRVTLAAPSTGS